VYVFPGQAGGPMAARWVSQELSRNLGAGTTAHMLRHRFLSRAYALGGRDLLAVQRLAGHSSPSTTVVYVLLSDESLERAVLAAGAS
jgi:integrase